MSCSDSRLSLCTNALLETGGPSQSSRAQAAKTKLKCAPKPFMGPSAPVTRRLSSCRHCTPLCATLTDGRDAASKVEPSLFLAKSEQVVAVRDLSGDDFFFSLLVCHRKSKLHWLIGRVLLGDVDEFYVERFLLLRLHCHGVFLVPGWELGNFKKQGEWAQSPMHCRLELRL